MSEEEEGRVCEDKTEIFSFHLIHVPDPFKTLPLHFPTATEVLLNLLGFPVRFRVDSEVLLKALKAQKGLASRHAAELLAPNEPERETSTR